MSLMGYHMSCIVQVQIAKFVLALSDRDLTHSLRP